MILKDIVRPLYSLPYKYQVKLLDFFVFLFNIFPINIKINYKEYSLELNSKDKSSSLIYISYLIHGRWNHEIFEQEVVDSLISKSGNVYFIDVGASYGMFTFLASKHKNVKSIISIEAYKPVSDRLQSNIDNNSINNVNLINMVVFDVDEDFYEITEFNNSEWNQFKKSFKKNNTIKSITLDKIIAKYIDKTDDFIFIKMDIEGNEPLALNGLKKFINSNVNIMLGFHVGVLEKNEGGAYDFAEKLLGIENSKIFIMHVGFKKLIPITSREYFFNIISIMKKQDFPNNLFNLLILKEDNTYLVENYIGQPLL